MQESPGAGFDPMQYPQGWATYAAEAIKKVVKIPVITSHSLRDPEYCEQILAEGKTDLVGLARQLLADPYWPVKAQYGEGQVHPQVHLLPRRLLAGVADGQARDRVLHQRGLRPAGLRRHEADRASRCGSRSSAADRPAWRRRGIATERGHHVTLFEKHAELGGAMLYVCMVPGKEKMRWYLDWIRDQLLDLNVDIRLNHAPTVDELRGFDVVLNATGAASYVPPVAGDASRVVPFEETMACPKVACECHPGGRKMRKLGQRVLLWGDSYAATDTAAWLADIGRRGHDRDREPRVRGRLRGHPHVRPAQALRAGRRGGPPLPPVQAPRHGDHVHDGRRDPRGIGGPPGQGLQPDRRSRSTTSSRATPGPRSRCSTSCAPPASTCSTWATRSRPRNLYHAVKEGSAFGLAVDQHLLFNPNGAILDDLPMDVLAQLTREDGPSYTAKRMLELAGVSTT